MKLVVIGGGSTYTPELVNSLVELHSTFPLQELWLMDIHPQRLEIVGGFAKRMVAAKGSPFKVILSQDRQEAIRGASYVITQFRVGMMEARRGDEYLGRRHNIVGQETTGIGGMAKAMRTIPVMLGITQDIQKVAPGALLVNFTNPSGLITEALKRHAPEVASVGLCNGPIGVQREIISQLEKQMGQTIDPQETFLDSLGLNHLSWYRDFTLKGQSLWDKILAMFIAELREEGYPGFPPETIEALGMIPNGYLQYYYLTGKKVKAQEKWPPSRAEQVMEIEKETLRLFADPKLIDPPDELMKRGGAYYSTLATRVINAHYNNLGEIHTLNVRNDGAVKEWPADWVLELPCRVDKAGVHPLPTQPLPPSVFGLLSAVKAYELLTVEAAFKGDRRAAYQAILAHPLGPDADHVAEVLDDLIETNGAWLPQFIH